jgi:hypothetical protein
MSVRPLLQANCERLLEQYHANLEGVLALQETLVEDILPSIVDEHNLDERTVAWVMEWLGDTGASMNH